MRHPFLRAGLFIAATAQSFAQGAPAPENQIIRVETDHAGLVLVVDKGGRVDELSFGGKETTAPAIPKDLTQQKELYPQAGDGFTSEPAIEATHADGNTSTDLLFVSQDSKPDADGSNVTRINLKDPAYPFYVTLAFRTYGALDVMEQWSEIHHDEPGPVQLDRFASSAPFLSGGNLSLTQFHGSYSSEMNPATEALGPGIKVIDSKLGVRAQYYRNPSFLLTRNGPPQETKNEVWAGMLEWPGSFQFAFENEGGITRALCGINPFASSYRLEPGRVFVTPAMVWAWSGSGVGPLSRNLHRWARQYVIRDGNKPRAVLLNNWEATHMSFDEKKIVGLFDGAKDLGMDLFLLDDGWFGVKYPRENNASSGLGDWEPNPKKLPDGITYLCDQAKQRGLRFGIWMEPEMVNQKSVLFEEHPDWAIQQPHRALQTQRDQLALDLSRPETKDYVFKCLDDLLTNNPGVSYVKWDCNRYLTQPGSTYLKPGEQSKLQIDYNFALLDIMKQVAARHPQVEMMVCAGGGGRVDYGSMRYFQEFWPSDNTDPGRRVTMQWDYSTFFPAIAIAGHVTRMGNKPLKFAFDVAMSARLGMDMDLAKLSPNDLAFAKTAIASYKKDILPVVQFGNLYRVENPHTGPRSVLNYVTDDGTKAILFVLQNGGSTPSAAKPQGLDATKNYKVTELDLAAGASSALPQNGQVIDGATLMRDGVGVTCAKANDSAVVAFMAQ